MRPSVSVNSRTSFGLKGYNVIGGSAFGDKLENDRAAALRRCSPKSVCGLRLGTISSLQTSRMLSADLSAPAQTLRAEAERVSRSHVRRSLTMDATSPPCCARSRRPRAVFVLMDHLRGIENGVGAYFNGAPPFFVQPVSTGSISASSPVTSAS